MDRSAEPLMDDACERGVAFLNGAPYGGGILVKGPDAQPKYAYRPAGEKIAGAVRAMQEACASYGVPLAAAALQFSVRDPRVTSTVVGVSEPSRIAEITELTAARIPAALWQQLDALAAPPELWLS
ncbi:MAG TPA: aldo/keto reductase [Streptosporangiaceae bacterium]